ncbi:MAG TPA: adenylate/guanylate cyclase domain-containing protein [Acidimicrobiia bacterium]|nr:adenylate/guanylate cyclase domain-containing protein [Acidimicrobiia bacterium]
MSDRNLPTGTVTFLFTDLEGSTRLWEEHPDAMQTVLARHDEILRDAVDAQDGHIVKTTGDGVHAAFADAAHAVEAALTAQRAIGGEAWAGTGALLVRMGVHTGPATARDGDYYGTAVNRAARLMSAAHGGQVLVSLATEEHLRDSGVDGFDIVELGEVRLRDLSRPERVFQLRAPGLVQEFPPLRTLDTFPSNLPTQVTSFVGRERDITGVADALTTARLVTITGVGGVGKTRLAVQVAAEVLPRYPGGAWLCELAAAGDPDTMAQVVATALGITPRSGLTLEESIVESLSGRELLVLLDNCEHLMDAAGRLAEAILHDCPGVSILATSREGLAVPGEQVRPLRSLTAPTGTSPDDVGASEAAHLFAERAQAVRPEFAVADNNAAAVAEICRRLDGIPLAIELAAARVASMSPVEIAGFLDERFRLLTGGRRTSVERHQTLRATVDWSYSLLDEQARLVFDRLGVFAGNFDNRAAEAVVTGDGIERWDVLDALTSLVAKSMVTVEETDAGVTRYQLLETMRQYAREQLDGAGDGDEWRRRHAAYYADFARELWHGLRGPDELAWRVRFRNELDNIRAAVTWSLDREDDDDSEVALRIIAELGFEVVNDRTVGVGGWALRAVDRARRADPGVRAAVLGAAAAELALSANSQTARPLATEALADDEPVDCRVRGIGTLALSLVETYAGHADEAMQLVGNLLVALEDGGDEWTRTGFQSTLSTWETVAGAADEARSHAELSLRLARASGNPSAIINATWALGYAAQYDDPDLARSSFEESVAIARQGGTGASFGGALGRLAALRARAGDAREAALLLHECITTQHDSGTHASVVGAFGYVFVAFELTGRRDAAAAVAGAMRAKHFGDVEIFSPSELAEQADSLARIRDTLGDERTDAELARGRALTYEQAVEFVVTELAAMIGAP